MPFYNGFIRYLFNYTNINNRILVRSKRCTVNFYISQTHNVKCEQLCTKYKRYLMLGADKCILKANSDKFCLQLQN